MYKRNIGRCWLLAIRFWLPALAGQVLAVGCFGQEVDAFVRVQMSPAQVVEKQPIKVKVTAYSSTWFAEPLDFQNVQVPNAFILPFSRTLSGIHQVNGKQYAGLEFFFLMFPYQAGEYTFPALEILTSIPPEGDYVGKPVTLKSKARAFTVSPLPAGKDTPGMVAKNVYLSERWSADLSQLKVGDVVTRTLFVRAKGTLPSFISALAISDPGFASVYPKQPTLKDERDDLDANGLRIEMYAYLFEKEGDFTIPAVSIAWWNPYVKRKFEKQLPAVSIHVADNPDLGLVSSVRDSLDQLSGLADEGGEPTMQHYVSMAGQIFKYAGPGLVLFWLISLILRRIIKRRKAYIGSEKYYFNQLKKNKDLKSLYRWYDAYRQRHNLSPDIRSAIKEFTAEGLDWSLILKAISILRRHTSVQSQDRSFAINPPAS